MMHPVSHCVCVYIAVEIFSRLSICFIIFASYVVKSTIKTMPMDQRLKTKKTAATTCENKFSNKTLTNAHKETT